ncbi:zinc finger matrin-type protein 4 [Engraulis encrasicolus]|uniref:zinc finger matrin-type protein 4 n=1 Tax=Engraulis encrasicolus TaxID=184585 RepID=UPI002FD2B0E7
MDYTVSLQVQHQLTVFPTHLYQGYSLELQDVNEEAAGMENLSEDGLTKALCMKSTDVDQGLFTDSYCKVCSAQLISESQRVAHYESRKHANKVRLYYMLHPVDGGCPAKKLRTDNGSEEGDVDKNKCCTLCNMSFTSAVVAQSHYQGKIHAKRLKLLLGEQPAITAKEVPPSPTPKTPSEASPMASPRQRRDSDRYCQLCNAWFNNPGMAQQHYDGKKHKKNAARADLLEQLGKTLDMGEMKGLKRSYTCDVCSVTLNSVAQYHAHLQGSKHQNNLLPSSKTLPPSALTAAPLASRCAFPAPHHTTPTVVLL